MRLEKAYDVYIVKMDKEIIAYCNSSIDAKHFIKYYKENCSPAKDAVFEYQAQVVLEVFLAQEEIDAYEVAQNKFQH